MKNLRRIFVWVVFTTLLSVVAAGTALAQDVVKVAPESHKVILENDQVRVLEVHVKPGEKVGMHSHPANVAYFMSDAKVRITLPDGKTQEREIKAGASVWSEATTHAAENIGTTELQEVQIELKGAATKPAKP